MNTLYTDLQALLQDHCKSVVCAKAKLMEKDLRSLLDRHKDAPDYESMFMSACVALANIHEALGLDPDDAEGAGPIIEAIAEQSNTISSYMDINEAAGKENEMLKSEIAQLRVDLEKCRNACLQEVSDFGQLQSALEEKAELILRVKDAEEDARQSKLSRLDQECLAIGQQIQRAAGELPDGWRIELELERGSGDTVLYNPSCQETHFSDNVDGLSHMISSAIDAAIEQEQTK